MNTARYSGLALERAAAAKLGELLESVPWLKGWAVERPPALQDDGFDLRVTVPISGSFFETTATTQTMADPFDELLTDGFNRTFLGLLLCLLVVCCPI